MRLNLPDPKIEEPSRQPSRIIHRLVSPNYNQTTTDSEKDTLSTRKLPEVNLKSNYVVQTQLDIVGVCVLSALKRVEYLSS
jgi:hypothetical protein